jgi:type I restriction enzyme, S subunit
MILKTKKLGEICIINRGKNPVLFKQQKNGMLPYLGAKFMRGTKDAEFALVSDKKSVLVLKKDLVIICDGSKSGDMFSGFDGILSSTMGKMDFDNKIIEPGYLKRFLDLNFELFNGSKKGAAIPHLNFNIFKNLEIPLPTLKIQIDIVAKLDEKFAKLKKVKEMRGKTLADTEKILSQTLHEIFEDGKKKGWEEKSFNDESILKMTSGGTPSRGNKSFYIGNIPWLKSGELQDNTNIINSEEKITKEAVQKSSAKLFPVGTVLFAMYGATAGKIGILGIESSTNQAVAGLIPVVEKLNNKFLYYFLMKKREEILRKAWGGAQPNLSQTILKRFSIPLPSINEQKKIVAKLDKLSEKLRTLRELQKTQLEDLKKLEKSYLREAFNGELV